MLKSNALKRITMSAHSAFNTTIDNIVGNVEGAVMMINRLEEKRSKNQESLIKDALKHLNQARTSLQRAKE